MKAKIPVSLEDTTDVEEMAAKTGLTPGGIINSAQRLHQAKVIVLLRKAKGFGRRFELLQALPVGSRHAYRDVVLERATDCDDYLALVPTYIDDSGRKDWLLKNALATVTNLDQMRHLRSFVSESHELDKAIGAKHLAMEREAVVKATTFAAAMKVAVACQWPESHQEGLYKALELATNLKQMRELENIITDVDAFVAKREAKTLEMARTFGIAWGVFNIASGRLRAAAIQKCLKLAVCPEHFVDILQEANDFKIEREACDRLMAMLTTFSKTYDVLDSSFSAPWFGKLFRHALGQLTTFEQATDLVAAVDQEPFFSIAWRTSLKLAKTNEDLVVVYNNAPTDIAHQAFKKLAARFPKKAVQAVQP